MFFSLHFLKIFPYLYLFLTLMNIFHGEETGNCAVESRIGFN